MRRVPRFGLGAVAVAVALGSAGGCGLPDDRSPRVITAQEAPLDLSEAPDDNASSFGDAEVTLYFVEGDRLAQVERSTQDPSLATAVRALLDRPTTEEEGMGLRTEIPAETELVADPVVTGGAAIINLTCAPDDETAATLPLNCGVRGVEGTAQLVAFAQLVCTATAVEGVDSVTFQQDSTPQPAPVDAGTSADPVTCGDYRSVRLPGS